MAATDLRVPFVSSNVSLATRTCESCESPRAFSRQRPTNSQLIQHLRGLINATGVNYVPEKRPNCRQFLGRREAVARQVFPSCFRWNLRRNGQRPFTTTVNAPNEMVRRVYVLSSLIEVIQKLVTDEISEKRRDPGGRASHGWWAEGDSRAMKSRERKMGIRSRGAKNNFETL